MPQSLAIVHIHVIFSTKNREPWIHDGVRERLHGYMAAALQGLDCYPVLFNSVEDHIHLLFDLGRRVSIADAVREVKASSSRWIKSLDPKLTPFAWQAGYGVFAVSMSNLDEVRDYIARQREHHRRMTFQDEYRAFLRRHNIQCDERYVWD